MNVKEKSPTNFVGLSFQWFWLILKFLSIYQKDCSRRYSLQATTIIDMF